MGNNVRVSSMPDATKTVEQQAACENSLYYFASVGILHSFKEH